MTLVRRATTDDVDRMVELAALKRAQYQEYSPIFWHPADRAEQAQRSFFNRLVVDSEWICLVHDDSDRVDGFLIAQTVQPPPVYDPGGKACMIDDFVVADPSLWATVGRALHDEAERLARDSGAVMSVTVCGQRDEAKRRALVESGAHIASEWYVRPIS